MSDEFHFGHISELTVDGKAYQWVFIDEDNVHHPIASYCMLEKTQMVELRSKPTKIVLPEKKPKKQKKKE